MRKAEKIKVSSSEDLLAFIPHIIGYWPECSVVCIGMAGQSLRATLRLDLPEQGVVNVERFAAVAAKQLASDHAADGAIVAIFASEDWTKPDHFPQRELYDALRVFLAAAGMPVKDAWFVGKENWRRIDCSDPSCCPWPGSSNSKITSSFVNTELIYRGSTVEGNPRERIPELTAVKDSKFAEQVSALTPVLCAGLDETGLAVNQLAITLGAWERTLVHWPERPDASMAAYLLASLDNMPVRDAVMVALATTPERSLIGVRGIGYLAPAVADPLTPAKWFSCELATGYEVEIFDESPMQLAKAKAAFSDILLGGSSESPRLADAPNWTRLDMAEEVLLFLSGSLTGPLKAPVLSMLGWISWCRGRGTWAGVYFQASQNHLPGYSLAHLMETLLDNGHVAAWAKNQQSAWPGYRAPK